MSKRKKANKIKSERKTFDTKSSLSVEKIIYPILIFAGAFLLYINTLFHDYTQDDAIVIYDNMFTEKGISGISGHLNNDTFFGFFKTEGKAKLIIGRGKPAIMASRDIK
jgi:hypothetical protein